MAFQLGRLCPERGLGEPWPHSAGEKACRKGPLSDSELGLSDRPPRGASCKVLASWLTKMTLCFSPADRVKHPPSLRTTGARFFHPVLPERAFGPTFMDTRSAVGPPLCGSWIGEGCPPRNCFRQILSCVPENMLSTVVFGGLQ